MKKVEVDLLIKTKPKSVIEAFTDSSLLHDWWGVEKTLIQKYVGGIYTLAWNVNKDGIGYVSTGIIEKCDDNELEITNFVYINPEKQFLGPMRLVIRAFDFKEYAKVYLCQDGYQDGGDWDWYYNSVKNVWPEILSELKDYLEKK